MASALKLRPDLGLACLAGQPGRRRRGGGAWGRHGQTWPRELGLLGYWPFPARRVTGRRIASKVAPGRSPWPGLTVSALIFGLWTAAVWACVTSLLLQSCAWVVGVIVSTA